MKTGIFEKLFIFFLTDRFVRAFNKTNKRE